MTTLTAFTPRATGDQATLEMPGRLTADSPIDNPTHITDLLGILMMDIENGLLKKGARPGVDYTYLDLAKLAMPLIQQGLNAGIVSWTAPAANAL